MYVTLLLAMMSFLSHSQTIRYVKQNGTGDGSSWDNASSDLQGMINASGTEQVWVAKGTYKPGTSRNASFSMKAGVKIYGSFAGSESNLSERTAAVMAANKSILSGDLNGDDVITGSGATLSITNNGENCYHVVFNNNNGLNTSNSLLDGFTITGGNADGSDGGGMYNSRVSPSLINLTFEGNQASKGGGIYNDFSSAPTINKVIFKRNKANSDGGGVCNFNQSSISLRNVTFEGNQASYGGGMHNAGSSNSSLRNVIFIGNQANQGGGMYNNTADPNLSNVTFTGNQANRGGGMYASTRSTVKNTIFWGNTTSDSGADVYFGAGTFSFSYCLFQLASSNYSQIGVNLGAGMLYAQNPLLVNTTDPDGADNIFGTADDGLQLLPCSPAINVGDNSGAESTDITGNPRTIGGTVDMGAYEYQGNAVRGARIYVNAAATANGDGSSWDTAYTDLQTALANARLCSQITEIWVAKGTYKPGTSRNASFSMKAGVKIYGSFAGTETNLSERTAAVMVSNKSILSGDLNGDDATAGKGENSYHVILNDNNGLTTSNSLLDGFTITGGNTGGDGLGGGMYNKSSSPSIVNCSFLDNEAAFGGGGIGNDDSSPSLANCSFSGNWGYTFGGGMYNFSESSPSLVNCIFLGNRAVYGGGMGNVINCRPSLVNCSFSGNMAISKAGGIYNDYYSPPSLKNCILWGNKYEFGSDKEVESSDSESNPTYTNTLVEGLAVGGFQGTENPLFINQPSAGLGTSGDLRLQACSPVLNAGNSADNSTTVDLGGNNRKVGTIDLGAYEYQSAPPATVTPTVSISHPTTCGGTNGSIRLSGFLNTTTYSVTYKKNSVSVSAANFTSDGSGVITLTGLGAGSYTDMVATLGTCVSNAATAVLTDPTKPTATISGTTTVCQNGSSPSITFTGQNGTGAYTFTYKLNEGTSQTATTTSGNSVTVPVTTGTAGEFTYRLVSVANPNNCNQTQTGSAVVTVNSLPTATILGTTMVCQSSASPNVTFTGANATAPYTFTYKINDGVAQTVKTVSGNSVTVPVATNTVGTFTYTLVSVSESSSTTCSQEQTGSAVVKVNPLPTASISGTTSVCQNSPTPSVTFTGANATAPYTFTYKINDGSPQTVTTTSGNSVTVEAPTGVSGSFVYTLISVLESSSTACSQSQTGSATVTVNPLPTASISGTTSVCQNSPTPSVTFTGANATAPYTFTYKINDGALQTVTTTSGNSVTIPVSTTTVGEFTYTLLSVSESSSTSCSQEQVGSVVVKVNPLPTASISGTVTVCQNSPSPSVTFTGANATAPYTFTYKINDGVAQMVKTVSGNSVTVPVSTNAAGTFTYTLVSVSESSSTSCSQAQSGSAEVKVQGKPTITLSTLQQTLNEGNSQTFCDTDANPVNSLQFTVSGLCVVGSPVWRVQVGSGAWSDWSPNAPVTQPSNNQPHRYQAACDANCPVTYTSPITVQINYRASTPQQVSLVADGVTVNEGESKEVCNLEGNVLIFNATCAAGEVLLFSVDGGDYGSVVPTQLVDGQFHNYRVRCRKSDGTASCIESESGVMRLKITNGLGQIPMASLNVTSGCGTPVSFSGTASCGSLTTVWYNASTNVALATLPSQTPTETTSYYARCQAGGGCLSEKSNVVTYTVIPVGVAPVVSVSSEVVCAGTTVTISSNCPAGSTTSWNTGVTTPSFEISFSNVTKQTYWAKCLFAGGCQSAESVKKEVYWNAFVVTLINVGQSKSAVKPSNDKALWSSQFVVKDDGPELAQSMQSNPTLYYAENVNKTAPRYWTINVDACALGTDGSLTFDLLATPETGVPQSFNTHENNAPYFMYANREGWTELYAQNHPAYGFYQDNGAGGNVYDLGLPKGLYKLGIRYWDQKGWGSIYPSTRKPQGNVLAYQEYWFRIQSKDGVGVGAARVATDVDSSHGGTDGMTKEAFAKVMPNPVLSVLRLQVSDSKGQKVNATLLDASGRSVLRRQFVPETNRHQEEFGVGELPTGMYFLQVVTAEKQTVLKVVKVE